MFERLAGESTMLVARIVQVLPFVWLSGSRRIGGLVKLLQRSLVVPEKRIWFRPPIAVLSPGPPVQPVQQGEDMRFLQR